MHWGLRAFVAADGPDFSPHSVGAFKRPRQGIGLSSRARETLDYVRQAAIEVRGGCYSEHLQKMVGR